MPLPPLKKIEYSLNHFPSDWQAVIFRNWGLVPAQRLAKILCADEQTVIKEALKLGLENSEHNEDWLSKGFITLIRQNWHILSYRQLLILLNKTEDELDFILKEDDFLDVKLGGFKPDVREPSYYKLSAQEEAATARIKKVIQRQYIKQSDKPFNFYEKAYTSVISEEKNYKIEDRIIYSYSALYGDSLIEGWEQNFPDVLLEKLSRLGINGIWFQGLLSKLVYYPFDERLCQNFKLRQQNLNKLIEKCRRYGIKIYLYLNEPRCLPTVDFKNFPHLKGHTIDGYSSLCLENEEVKKYLFDAVKQLCLAVPDLGGIITITMSENLTHCNSKRETNCPKCKYVKPQQSAAQVNNIIAAAIKKSGSDIKLIANLWGWSEFMGWSEEQTLEGITLLDKDIIVLSVSEYGLKINKGGVQNTVIDYSISNAGPSEITLKSLKHAKQKGHKIYAKVQINNTWELSPLPFIPVFELIAKHLQNLNDLGIEGLMLSWTQGSYPSLSLYLAKRYYGGGKVDIDDWYLEIFGEHYKQVKRAVRLLSSAFTYFPFDLSFLYFGCQNLGTGNLWNIKPTGLNATMLGYPYDDIDTWRGPYSRYEFEKLLKKLVSKWRKGLNILKNIDGGNQNVIETALMAEVCYIHFYSALLQFQFNSLKTSTGNEKHLIKLAKDELKLTKNLYRIISHDARIGFEPSNHYFYYQNSLLEKILNLKNIIRTLKENLNKQR